MYLMYSAAVMLNKALKIYRGLIFNNLYKGASGLETFVGKIGFVSSSVTSQ